MRVSVAIVSIVLTAVAVGGCSTYSRYEHEEQVRQESRERWRDAEPQRRRSRPVREASRRPANSNRADTEPGSVYRPRAAATTPPETAAMSPSAARPAATTAPSPPRAAAAAPVAPAAATPQAPAATEPPSPALLAARKEIADGYRLLRAGFVKKARERFDTAMTAAAGEATLGYGRSMDPTYLKGVAFPDAEPDVEEARKLYRRAILLGTSEAKSDLDRLDSGTATAQPAGQQPSTQPQ